MASGGFELPKPCGGYQADEDDEAEGSPIVWINMPDDWLFETASDGWMSLLAERARDVASQRRVDTRAVLYGLPMLEFMATRVLAARAERVDQRTDEDENERMYNRIRSIHAEWLMTPRDDLLGRTPREALLRKTNHIGLEIQYRSDQWSRQGFAPPALEEDSAAYRFGGYGITEIVMYFHLLRSLLGAAWDRAAETPSQPGALVERLLRHRDEYLNQPPEDSGSGPNCRELIESERRRMPIASDGSHLDCDCPICQAEAEGAFGSSPAFMFYDGHQLELEDEFAFSTIESRAEWEREQGKWRDYSAEMDREQAEHEATREQPTSVWTSSFVDWESAVDDGTSPLSSKMAIGFLLAELVALLQQRDGGRANIEALNAAFTRFRRADDQVVEHSAAEELRNCLENAAAAFSDLISRSADLQSRLDEVLRLLVTLGTRNAWIDTTGWRMPAPTPLQEGDLRRT